VQYLQFLQLIRHLLTIRQNSASGFAQMATKKSTLLPLTQGEKLMILVHRSGMTGKEIAALTGYGRTYISKLYNNKTLNKQQVTVLSQALSVPPSIFEEELERRIIALEKEVQNLKALENRVRILEAENSGLRQALQN